MLPFPPPGIFPTQGLNLCLLCCRRSLINIFAFHFKVKIDLQVTMPHSYPYVALQMFARSPELDRQQQLLLNKGLTSYIGTFDPGELCVCAAIQWLQDNSASYFLNRKLMDEPSTQAKPVKNIRRGVRASGPSQERTGESGAFGLWPHPRGSSRISS